MYTLHSFVTLLLVCALSTPSVLSVPQASTPSRSLHQHRTLKLQSRVSPHGSLLKKRALGSENVALADYFKGTDLQWYGNISVGTPPQELKALFDTSTNEFEVASTLCGSACDKQIKFDPSKSSTYQDSNFTRKISFLTGNGVKPVEPKSGYIFELWLSNGIDTVTIGDLKAPNTYLSLITNKTAPFADDPYSAAQGMGTTPGGFFQSLVHQGMPAIFGMYLTPKAVGEAEITLGGIDDSKYKGNLTYANVVHAVSWDLNSTKIAVNGKTNKILNSPRTVTIGSGTSNVILSKNVTEAIYAFISPDIKPYAPQNGTYGLPCSKVPGLIKSKSAEIVLTFNDVDGKPFGLTIPSRELSVGPFEGQEEICQMLINAFDGANIVGGSLMKYYYVVHDVDGQMMGFAPNGF